MPRILLSLCCLLAACTTTTTELEFQAFDSPAGEESSLSRLFTDNTGTVFMSWVEERNDTANLYYARLEDDQWTNPEEVASSDKWFVNWADFPSVIGYDGKAMAAHWLAKIPGSTYSYNVQVASASSSWEKSMVPHDDNTPTEHGFVSMVPASDSTFLALWLDGRNTGSGHGPGNIESAMTLRSAILSSSLDKLAEDEVDASVCDCCGTAAIATEDGFLIAYRDRTQDEIRDIYFARYQNGSWSDPQPVHNDNWNIAACPVNGPALSASGSKTAVAWFTAANDTAKVKLSFMNSGEGSFGEPILINETDNYPLGRVDVEVLDDESTIVSWMERSAEDPSRALFRAKLFNAQNQLVKTFDLTDMSSARTSGFPQITKSQDGLLLSWTEISEDRNKKVKTAILR